MAMVVRCIAAIAGSALIGAIIWAMGERSLFESFPEIIADPWGLVTIVDLYAGFVLFAVIIASVERKAWVAAVWIAPMPFVGNLVPALWLILNARRLVSFGRQFRAR